MGLKGVMNIVSAVEPSKFMFFLLKRIVQRME